MEPDDLSRWVEGYLRAWNSNDPDEIAALFTPDAVYYTAPFREPWTGHQAIVQGWLDRKDEPGDWSFAYEVLAVAGRLGFVRGRTGYPGQQPSEYSNLWVIRLEPDGSCSEFTEWWMAND